MENTKNFDTFLPITRETREQALKLLDQLGSMKGLFIADRPPPPGDKRSFRCLTCWYYPNRSPCWHSPPYQLNPKLMTLEWREGLKGYVDWHDHLHTYHVLFAIENPKPTLIMIASTPRELTRVENQLRSRFLKRVEREY